MNAQAIQTVWYGQNASKVAAPGISNGVNASTVHSIWLPRDVVPGLVPLPAADSLMVPFPPNRGGQSITVRSANRHWASVSPSRLLRHSSPQKQPGRDSKESRP